MTIHKFLATNGQFTLDLPPNAKFLSVAVKNERPVMWFLLEPAYSETFQRRKFCAYVTGDMMPDDPGTFLGTVLLDGGAFVLHIFESRP